MDYVDESTDLNIAIGIMKSPTSDNWFPKNNFCMDSEYTESIGFDHTCDSYIDYTGLKNFILDNCVG
jgi:hypothetical protein